MIEPREEKRRDASKLASKLARVGLAVRVAWQTRDRFKKACVLLGVSEQEVVEDLLHGWLERNENQLHLTNFTIDAENVIVQSKRAIVAAENLELMAFKEDLRTAIHILGNGQNPVFWKDETLKRVRRAKRYAQDSEMALLIQEAEEAWKTMKK